MLFGVGVEHEYDLIMIHCNTVIHLSKRINCCSVYMNKTLYGYTPNENGSLDLDRSDTHIHNIDAKRCKVDNDSATCSWHCRLDHIGLKRIKKLHKDGLGIT